MTQVTFPVSPEVGLGEARPAVDAGPVLGSSLRGQIEALWTPSAPLIECSEDHALLSAVSLAFFGHYPLELSPDAVWLTLARGFALHVNQNAEALRHRFVRHEGKETLVVDRPDFLPGRANPWPEAFDDFSDQIAARVGELSDFVRCDFSTTTPTALAASDLMVVETFKAYFEYEMRAGCGIPSITLTGTVADWKSIRRRAAQFPEFGLEAWCWALDPILVQFVAAAEGHADTRFWRSLFRYNGGSGPSVMTGWINVFFPYLKDRFDQLKPNPYLKDWKRRLTIDERQTLGERWADPQGVGMGAVPPCLTSVPMKVSWGTASEETLRLVGGLMGVSQDPETLAVRPECGWAVVRPVPAGPTE